MPENKKPTFAQQAILNRIAQKNAVSDKKFQDYTEHTDYNAYTDYGDAWHQLVNADGEPDGEYCEVYGEYCDEAPTSPAPQKPNFLQNMIQRIFGSRNK